MLRDFEDWACFVIPPAVLGLLLLGSFTSNLNPSNVMKTLFPYLIPFAIPLLTRGLLAIKYRDIRKDGLTKDQRAGELHRGLILGMAAFSFAGVLGITLLQSPQNDLRLPAFYLMVSFLFYFAALNWQNYKFNVGREILSDFLIDTANLSLISSVMFMVLSGEYDLSYKVALFAIALVAWLPDQILGIKYLSKEYTWMREQKGKPTGGYRSRYGWRPRKQAVKKGETQNEREIIP